MLKKTRLFRVSEATFQSLNDILLKYPGPEHRTQKVQTAYVKILQDKVKNTIFSQDMATSPLPSSTVHEFILSLMSVREKIRGDIEGANRYNTAMHPNNNNNNNGTDINFAQNKKQRLDNRPNHNKNNNNNNNKLNPCYICGRNTHIMRLCTLIGHPDRNQQFGIPFKDSF